jgi:hypothetical protein
MPLSPQATWKSDVVWTAIAATVVGYEIWTLRSDKLDYTLTRTARRAFRTTHPVGKAMFLMGWGSFSVWFARHIVESSDPMDAVLRMLKGNHES